MVRPESSTDCSRCRGSLPRTIVRRIRPEIGQELEVQRAVSSADRPRRPGSLLRRGCAPASPIRLGGRVTPREGRWAGRPRRSWRLREVESGPQAWYPQLPAASPDRKRIRPSRWIERGESWFALDISTKKLHTFRPWTSRALVDTRAKTAPRVGDVSRLLVSRTQDEPGLGIGRIESDRMFARLDGCLDVALLQRRAGVFALAKSVLGQLYKVISFLRLLRGRLPGRSVGSLGRRTWRGARERKRLHLIGVGAACVGLDVCGRRLCRRCHQYDGLGGRLTDVAATHEDGLGHRRGAQQTRRDHGSKNVAREHGPAWCRAFERGASPGVGIGFRIRHVYRFACRGIPSRSIEEGRLELGTSRPRVARSGLSLRSGVALRLLRTEFALRLAGWLAHAASILHVQTVTCRRRSGTGWGSCRRCRTLRSCCRRTTDSCTCPSSRCTAERRRIERSRTSDCPCRIRRRTRSCPCWSGGRRTPLRPLPPRRGGRPRTSTGCSASCS